MSQHSAASHNSHAVPDTDAVLRDDVLIDALAKGVLPMEHYTDELVRTTLTWRDSIHTTEYAPSTPLGVEEMMREAGLAAPLMTAVEDETRVLAVPYNDFEKREDAAAEVPTQRAAHAAPEPPEPPAENDGERKNTPHKRFAWVRRPALLLAACAALALGSLGSVAAANVAEPGSVLWPVTKAINPERAHSLEARNEAQDSVTQAREAIDEGRASEAEKHLKEAEQKADNVREKDGRDNLTDEVSAMKKKLEGGSEKDPVEDEKDAKPKPTGEVTPSPSPTPSTSPSTTPEPSPSTSPSSSARPSPSADNS